MIMMMTIMTMMTNAIFFLSVEEHNTGKIVGGVLGAVASVILVLGLVIMVACKKFYSQEG